jgi:short-subunit dehydrogenase
MKSEIFVITGAASGIGKALSELLLANGHLVYALDISVERLKEMETWAKGHDYQLKTVTMDVTNTDGIEDFLSKINQEGIRINTWIHGAGISGIGSFENVSITDFERILDINLLSIVRSTRLVLKHMQANGFGKIVVISSVAGFVPAPMMSAYNLTKHALVGFTRSMQLEMKFHSSPVQFVLVCPGFVETEMIRKGQDMGFPEWLSPILSNPESVAKEIFQGLKKGKNEIFPTLNGKTLMILHQHFPKLVRSQSRLLTVKSLKDLILNRH